ncbi:MAG TPA: hypothetical protein VFV68_07005 [Agriterribacter sp.]|nr:hypothetical protein [Agriterribacter sp.]
MKPDSDIEKELKEISQILPGMNKVHPFQVSTGYFEHLPEAILKCIKERKEEPAISRDEEISQLSPLIASLKDKTTFTLPTGYFNDFTTQILEKIAEPKTEASVYQMHSKPTTKRKWMKYAIAAALAGVVVLSLPRLWKANTNAPVSTILPIERRSVAGHLPEISDSDLTGYLSNIPGDDEFLLENIDTEADDIVFLNLDDATLGNMLKEIPDDALINYANGNFDKQL